LTRIQIPYFDRFVPTAGGKLLSIRTEGNIADHVLVTIEREYLLTGYGIPDLYHTRLPPTPNSRSHSLGIGAISNAPGISREPFNCESFFASLRIPDLYFV
jgi:hypothetical protein